jgi:hypothetical protein
MTVWFRCRIAFVWTIAAFAFMTVVPHLGAESALETIMAMGDYLSSAVRLFSGTQARVDSVEPKKLEKQDQDAVRAELQELMRALDSLLPAQQVFIGDLHGYIRSVKADSFDSPAQMEKTWKATLGGIGELVTATQDVLKIVTRPDSKLDIAIADADRVTLQSALSQRITLLSRFRGMPPPKTQGEIAQLAIMAERYDELRKTAMQLRVSLGATLRKFPA